MSFIPRVVVCSLILIASGCATVTGIPSHGGGKRFFIEQELISASVRAASQCLALEHIEGEKCALFLTTVGDQGAGNLVGGKYQWQAAIRGDYISNPTTATSNSGGLANSLTTTRDGAGNLLQTIESASPLIFPSRSESQAEGFDARAGGGFGYNGNGQYNALGFLNNDTGFLGAVIREALVLKGIKLTTPDQADIFIYATVDAFGTNRSRTEMHVYNQERLRAKTALHVTAFDRKGNVKIPSQTSSWEADYRERYIFWCGPFEIEKRVYQSDDLLVSFDGLSQAAFFRAEDKRAGEELPEPANGADDKNEKATEEPKINFGNTEDDVSRLYRGREESTRPGDLTRDLTQPDPSRPEDVGRYNEGGFPQGNPQQ